MTRANFAIAFITHRDLTVRGIILGIAIKWLLLVPLFVCWQRMTWRGPPAPRGVDLGAGDGDG